MTGAAGALVTRVAGALVALVAICWSLDLQTRVGTLVYAEQLIAVMLGLGIFGVYWKLDRPVFRALAVVALAVMLWIGWRFPVLQADMLGHPVEAITLSVLEKKNFSKIIAFLLTTIPQNGNIWNINYLCTLNSYFCS